jgi:hypothetical protein
VTGAPSTKPSWILTSSRGGSWFFADFYTVFAAFELYEAVTHGLWWQWVLAVGFLFLSVLSWISLTWVIRHPPIPPSSEGDADG